MKKKCNHPSKKVVSFYMTDSKIMGFHCTKCDKWWNEEIEWKTNEFGKKEIWKNGKVVGAQG